MSGYDDRDSGSDEEPFNPEAEVDEDDVPTNAHVRRPAVADDDDDEEGGEENDDDEEDDDEEEEDDEDEEDAVVRLNATEMNELIH